MLNPQINLLERLNQHKPLILDGAMGTELSRRGFPIDLPLWSAKCVLDHSEAIQKIHEDYIHIGADIITTCTFRTDSRTFKKAELSADDARSATVKAVRIAKSSVDTVKPDRQIWIAGSMSTLEDCYRPELAPNSETARKEHREKAAWLAEAGVDFILIETMNSFTEAIATSTSAIETGLPVITSFILNQYGKILNDDDLFEACSELKALGVNGISVNCTHHSIITSVLNRLVGIGLPVCVYPNAGVYDDKDGWKNDPLFTPESYSKIASDWIRKGVRIVGGCCGTSPEHIQAISARLKKGGF